MGANLDGIAGDEVVVEGARGFGQAQPNISSRWHAISARNPLIAIKPVTIL